MNASPTNTAEELLASVGLAPDFLLKLVAEDDWSLIIKLHAVFEAVLGSLIVKELGKPSVSDVVAQLDFNNIKTGKVAFARALGLLDKREMAFLRGLSELRNALVHNVQNVGFDIRTHVLALDLPKRKKFKAEFGGYVKASPDGDREYEELLARNPGQLLMYSAYGCLLTLHFKLSEKRRNLLIEALTHRANK